MLLLIEGLRGNGKRELGGTLRNVTAIIGVSCPGGRHGATATRNVPDLPRRVVAIVPNIG
jgi:hypothetical protein